VKSGHYINSRRVDDDVKSIFTVDMW